MGWPRTTSRRFVPDETTRCSSPSIRSNTHCPWRWLGNTERSTAGGKIRSFIGKYPGAYKLANSRGNCPGTEEDCQKCAGETRPISWSHFQQLTSQRRNDRSTRLEDRVGSELPKVANSTTGALRLAHRGSSAFPRVQNERLYPHLRVGEEIQPVLGENLRRSPAGLNASDSAETVGAAHHFCKTGWRRYQQGSIRVHEGEPFLTAVLAGLAALGRGRFFSLRSQGSLRWAAGAFFRCAHRARCAGPRALAGGPPNDGWVAFFVWALATMPIRATQFC